MNVWRYVYTYYCNKWTLASFWLQLINYGMKFSKGTYTSILILLNFNPGCLSSLPSLADVYNAIIIECICLFV